MKIEIQGKPEFLVPLTRAQVSLLICLSRLHYDATCKSMSVAGGRIYGWANQTKWEEREAKEGSRDIQPVVAHASFRDLDICLKIMECACMAHQSRLITDMEYVMVGRMRVAFHAALSRANEVYRDWTTTVETEG